MGGTFSGSSSVFGIGIMYGSRTFDFDGGMCYFICDINSGGSLKL